MFLYSPKAYSKLCLSANPFFVVCDAYYKIVACLTSACKTKYSQGIWKKLISPMLTHLHCLAFFIAVYDIFYKVKIESWKGRMLSMCSAVIKNGLVVDGSGDPRSRVDILIENMRIVKVGKVEGGRDRVIDAEGLIVAPGFIDIHSHSDFTLPIRPRAEGKIMQGVTTEVVGNCGLSPAPVKKATLSLLRKYVDFVSEEGLAWNWSSLGDYLDHVESEGVAVNVVPLVGQGTVRVAVMGFDNRLPSKDEMDEMKALIEGAMEDGAFGISSGLVYPPGMYTSTDELIELCKVASKHGGIYTSHIRGESDSAIQAVEEAIEIGERAQLPVEISHHKAAGKANWGKTVSTLRIMDEARVKGSDVTCDLYPYTAAMTTLTSILPPWVLEGGVDEALDKLKNPKLMERIKRDVRMGRPDWQENYVKASGWEGIMIAACKSEKNKVVEGKTVDVIAKSRNVDPFDFVFQLLEEEGGSVSMVLFMMCEEDVCRIMKHQASMIGTDGIDLSYGKPHPRAYGTYPRVLEKYVREEGILTLEEAVKKMTSLPAEKLRLMNRGLIKEGMWADIVVFDPKNIEERGTYLDPRRYPKGIEYVLVNGEVVVEKGTHTGALAGKVLRRREG